MGSSKEIPVERAQTQMKEVGGGYKISGGGGRMEKWRKKYNGLKQYSGISFELET